MKKTVDWRKPTSDDRDAAFWIAIIFCLFGAAIFAIVARSKVTIAEVWGANHFLVAGVVVAFLMAGVYVAWAFTVPGDKLKNR